MSSSLDLQAAAPPQSRNALGRSSLTLGVTALVLPWLLIWVAHFSNTQALIWVSYVGVVLGVLLGTTAVALGASGVRRVQRGLAGNRAQALTGLVVGLVALALSLYSLLQAVSLFLAVASSTR